MTELSLTFVAHIVLSMLIAAVGILLDQPILVVGAMVVGPEFGPLAGLCVAIVERGASRSPGAPWRHWRRGFRSASSSHFLVTLAFDGATAGILSLTSTKCGAWSACSSPSRRSRRRPPSPSAAPSAPGRRRGGAAIQLGLNLAAIVRAGIVTLYLQRRRYAARRRRRLSDPIRKAAGLSVERSREGAGSQ